MDRLLGAFIMRPGGPKATSGSRPLGMKTATSHPLVLSLRGFGVFTKIAKIPSHQLLQLGPLPDNFLQVLFTMKELCCKCDDSIIFYNAKVTTMFQHRQIPIAQPKTDFYKSSFHKPLGSTLNILHTLLEENRPMFFSHPRQHQPLSQADAATDISETEKKELDADWWGRPSNRPLFLKKLLLVFW